eukprot:TRINITY_DN5720_c0_g1_i1.p1 TRINITY_DN5720_c0_g1~~TRINITY_DN5720_c0_g1_i1.p1  ORF type:complete len:414 (+),score=41.51 TRINITY_DN5720_c0_g1_i1:230-1471(+)
MMTMERVVANSAQFASQSHFRVSYTSSHNARFPPTIPRETLLPASSPFSLGERCGRGKAACPSLSISSPFRQESVFRRRSQRLICASLSVGAGDSKAPHFHRVRPAVRLTNLTADDFRHPLDRQNTAILRAFPGLSDLGRVLLGPVAEQMMLLENMGTSVLVGPSQLSRLHELMVEAAEILNMPAPDLYVRQSPVPNAYTLAITGQRPFVVVHTALVDLLSPAEIQAVFAHELGHLKCDHGLWLTFANVIALGAYSVPGLGAMIARNMEDQILRWLRAAELTCDRAAVLVAQDPKVVVSVLMKLAGGSPSLARDLNVDAFLQQARSYDEAASSSPLSWYLRNAQTRQLSHPLPVLRAREIDQWARGREYKALVERSRREASVIKGASATSSTPAFSSSSSVPPLSSAVPSRFM